MARPTFTGTRLESTTVYFEPGKLERLRAISDKTRVPWSVYVREALDQWLERNEATLLGGAPPETADTSPPVAQRSP